jgi:hypothetical protein
MDIILDSSENYRANKKGGERQRRQWISSHDDTISTDTTATQKTADDGYSWPLQSGLWIHKMLHIPPRKERYGIEKPWSLFKHINKENKQVVFFRLLVVWHFAYLRVSANTN